MSITVSKVMKLLIKCDALNLWDLVEVFRNSRVGAVNNKMWCYSLCSVLIIGGIQTSISVALTGNIFTFEYSFELIERI